MDDTSERDRPLAEQQNAHFLLKKSELSDGQRAIINVQDREVAVFNVDGELYGFENFCAHQGGPVCEGVIKGTFSVDSNFELVYDEDEKQIMCPWHGWEFNIESGEHTPTSRYKLIPHDLAVDGDDIFVIL